MQHYEWIWGWKHWGRKQFILYIGILIVGSAILIGISDLANKAELGPDPHPGMSSFLQAKALWSGLKFTHYKMIVERTNWGIYRFALRK